MDQKQIGRLLLIASIALLFSAAIFLCLCLFAQGEKTLYLLFALGSLVLSSLFNIIRRQTEKQKEH